MGNKIIEGFLNTKLKKFEKYVKNFKHVASFAYLQKIGSENKFEVGFSKIPFPRETELNEFEKSYNQIIDLLADQNKEENKSNEK
jgi:hypothetical protein